MAGTYSAACEEIAKFFEDLCERYGFEAVNHASFYGPNGSIPTTIRVNLELKQKE